MGKDKEIALVTGGNKGIGWAVVADLAERGFTVLLGARDDERGARAAAELGSADVHPLRLDVTDPASIVAAASIVTDRFGRLDVLVNNAGISGVGTTANEVFATNVLGVIGVTEAMTDLLRQSAAGRIVNVSSGIGSLTRMSDPDDRFSQLPPLVAYAASKSAVNSLTVQYAKAFRADGILVNAADPGPCATDLTRGGPGEMTRTAEDGAVVVVRLATLGPDGPSGGCYNDDGPVPW